MLAALAPFPSGWPVADRHRESEVKPGTSSMLLIIHPPTHIHTKRADPHGKNLTHGCISPTSGVYWGPPVTPALQGSRADSSRGGGHDDRSRLLRHRTAELARPAGRQRGGHARTEPVLRPPGDVRGLHPPHGPALPRQPAAVHLPPGPAIPAVSRHALQPVDRSGQPLEGIASAAGPRERSAGGAALRR